MAETDPSPGSEENNDINNNSVASSEVSQPKPLLNPVIQPLKPSKPKPAPIQIVTSNEDVSDDMESDPFDQLSSSPSINEEEIDFHYVYALRTFVATEQGQANAFKGDAMVLLNDANSYWWLVRMVKDSSVGFLPAEHIETPTERLARLNKHRNGELCFSLNSPTDPSKSIGKMFQKKSKKKLANRQPKSVSFTSTSIYVSASEYEYSDDDETTGVLLQQDLDQLHADDGVEESSGEEEESSDDEDEVSDEEASQPHTKSKLLRSGPKSKDHDLGNDGDDEDSDFSSQDYNLHSRKTPFVTSIPPNHVTNSDDEEKSDPIVPITAPLVTEKSASKKSGGFFSKRFSKPESNNSPKDLLSETIEQFGDEVENVSSTAKSSKRRSLLKTKSSMEKLTGRKKNNNSPSISSMSSLSSNGSASISAPSASTGSAGSGGPSNSRPMSGLSKFFRRNKKSNELDLSSPILPLASRSTPNLISSNPASDNVSVSDALPATHSTTDLEYQPPHSRRISPGMSLDDSNINIHPRSAKSALDEINRPMSQIHFSSDESIPSQKISNNSKALSSNFQTHDLRSSLKYAQGLSDYRQVSSSSVFSASSIQSESAFKVAGKDVAIKQASSGTSLNSDSRLRILRDGPLPRVDNQGPRPVESFKTSSLSRATEKVHNEEVLLSTNEYWLQESRQKVLKPSTAYQTLPGNDLGKHDNDLHSRLTPPDSDAKLSPMEEPLDSHNLVSPPSSPDSHLQLQPQASPQDHKDKTSISNETRFLSQPSTITVPLSVHEKSESLPLSDSVAAITPTVSISPKSDVMNAMKGKTSPIPGENERNIEYTSDKSLPGVSKAKEERAKKDNVQVTRRVEGPRDPRPKISNSILKSSSDFTGTKETTDIKSTKDEDDSITMPISATVSKDTTAFDGAKGVPTSITAPLSLEMHKASNTDELKSTSPQGRLRGPREYRSADQQDTDQSLHLHPKTKTSYSIKQLHPDIQPIYKETSDRLGAISQVSIYDILQC